MKDYQFATKAIHSAQEPDPTTGALMTPIYQNSTFAQSAPAQPIGDFEYGRTGNPTRSALEQNLAALEQGTHGFCFASGCAALSTVLHILKSGDEVIFNDDVYGGSFRLFSQVFNQFNIKSTVIDFSNTKNLQQALSESTRLIWIETPTNPLLKIIDIQLISQTIKNFSQQSSKIILAVDNTFATPYFQNPLQLGADLVIHSCTKYIGGHSDIISGAVVTNDSDIAEKLSFYQNAIGAVPAPMDCFLLLRSTKTLALRMQAHSSNAMYIATLLENHPKIETVLYPGLASHPQHQLAKQQMSGYSGMISIYLKQNKPDNILTFLQSLRLFRLAESLGGVESLIEHPATMTHACIPQETRDKLGIRDNLIRLSVGIEDKQDLQYDLERALEKGHT